MLVLGLGLMSCEGPQGPRGEQGLEGKIGPAGENGSVIHAGEGAPADDLGQTGDFYLDTAAGEMYGPKTQDGWDIPFMLQGPAGSDGESGSQIFAGNGTPDASLGVVGDYYLDKANYDLYGPKAADGWGTPISLRGTANVLYTTWFEPVWDQVDNARHKRLRITESRLTAEFKTGGVVLVYHRDIPSPGNLQDRLLPNTVYFVDGEMARVYRSEIIGNGVYIEVRSFTQDLDPDDYDTEHNRFRYVLIPGGEELTKRTHQGRLPIDLSKYRQVKKYFGIKE